MSFNFAGKVRLLKLQDADPERDAYQPNLTSAQLATLPANKQTKEKVPCVGLNSSLEQFLQRVGMHYPAENSSGDDLKEWNVNQLVRLCAYEPIADAAVDGLP